MSIETAIQYLNDVESQFSTATNCEAIETAIEKHTKAITDAVTSHVESITNIASDWAPLLQLPTDPLKILKWAAKVVAGPIATQIAIMAEMAIDMAKLAEAVASLAGAIANAAVALASCLESAIRGKLDEITNTLLAGASDLITQAESIVSQLQEQSGLNALTDAVDGVLTDVGTIDTAIDSVQNSIDLLPDPSQPLI